MATVSRSNLCPVCGYDLGFAPWESEISSQEICPCCGIQYGLDDAAGGDLTKRASIYNKWRKKWQDNGMPWSGIGVPRPDPWNPSEQVERIVENQ